MTITDKDYKALTNYDRELIAGNTKATMKQVGATSADLWKVPLNQIHILPGYNPRIPGAKYEEKIEWLTEQIMTHGFYSDKPLAGFVTMENDVQKIYVQDGQSRLLAARRAVARGAPIEVLPMVMKDRSMNMLDLTIALVTSNEGEPFGPMEKAALVKRFKAFDKTDAEIATYMRCSAAYVGQLATLAGAPKKIREMVVSGEVSATNAIETMRKHGEGAVDALTGALENAKAKGKGKASAKDSVPDEAAAATARQKKFGPALYALIVQIVEHKATTIAEEFQNDLDSMLFRIEQVEAAPEPKAKPAKKVKAEKKAKVQADLAETESEEALK